MYQKLNSVRKSGQECSFQNHSAIHKVSNISKKKKKSLNSLSLIWFFFFFFQNQPLCVTMRIEATKGKFLFCEQQQQHVKVQSNIFEAEPTKRKEEKRRKKNEKRIVYEQKFNHFPFDTLYVYCICMWCLVSLVFDSIYIHIHFQYKRQLYKIRHTEFVFHVFDFLNAFPFCAFVSHWFHVSWYLWRIRIWEEREKKKWNKMERTKKWKSVEHCNRYIDKAAMRCFRWFFFILSFFFLFFSSRANILSIISIFIFFFNHRAYVFNSFRWWSFYSFRFHRFFSLLVCFFFVSTFSLYVCGLIARYSYFLQNTHRHSSLVQTVFHNTYYIRTVILLNTIYRVCCLFVLRTCDGRHEFKLIGYKMTRLRTFFSLSFFSFFFLFLLSVLSRCYPLSLSVDSMEWR